MSDQRPRRRRSAVTLVAVAVLTVGACADASPSAPADADEALIEALAWRAPPADSGASGCAPLHESMTSLGELLPNARFRGPDGAEFARADVVVVGRFTGVEPGRGLVLPEPDGPSDLPVAFDDPDAIYRTVHARLDVESVVGGEVAGDTALVGFQVDGAGSDDSRFPSLAQVQQGLPALGRVVVLLDRGAFYEYDAAVLGLVDGLFLGRLGPDDRLDLPLLPQDDAARLLDGTPTLADLERAAAEPVEVVDVGICGESPPAAP